MAIQKAAAPSTWPDEELILAMMEHEDDYVPMPPVEESTVRVRVKSVEEAKPRPYPPDPE